MNISNDKLQGQFELFSGASQYSEKNAKIPSQIKCLTLSIENIIVLSIIFVMGLVLFFAFGVEKGKALVLNNPEFYEKYGTVQDVPAAENVSATKDVAQKDAEVHKIVIEQETVKPEITGTEEVPVPVENIPSDVFTVQVASFKKEQQAEQEADTLKKIGHDPFVLPKGKYSIVCVGKFAQKDEAKRFSNKLKSRYHDLYVRRL